MECVPGLAELATEIDIRDYLTGWLAGYLAFNVHIVHLCTLFVATWSGCGFSFKSYDK